MDYKIVTENIQVFDRIAGIDHATKILPTINTSNKPSALIVVTF